MQKSKRRKLIENSVEREKSYSLEDAVKLLKDVKKTKFDETVEVALRLGVDPRKADQMVRGTCSLPHGLGKQVRVLVLVKNKDKADEATAAGADYVGADEFIQKIQKGWFEFDRVIATPDMMPQVGKIGKLLGPRGLMPNPKTGTVTNEVSKTVTTIKAGQIEFKVDKNGNLHAPVGKISFDDQKIVENVNSLKDTIMKLKPSTAKGVYMKNVSVSTTMGPGIRIES